MRKISLAFVLALTLLSLNIYAQNVSVQDSREFINAALRFKSSEKYEKAISQLDKVNRNDTNYEESLHIKAGCYVSLEQYAKAVDICSTGIALDGELITNFYSRKAYAQNEIGRYEQTIKDMDVIIARFPFDYNMKAERGRAMIMNGQAKEGLEAIYDILRENPQHAPTHMILGQICFDRGMFAQGLMAYDMYLFLIGDTRQGFGMVAYVDSRLSKKLEEADDEDAKFKGAEKYLDQGFDEINTLVMNKVANGKKYKTKSKLTYPIINQSHLVMSNLESVDGSGFWHEFYIPWYKDVWESGQFEGFSYKILASGQGMIDDVDKVYRKKVSKITAVTNYGTDKLKELKSKSPEDKEGHKIEGNFFYVSDYMQGLGEMKYDRLDGPWKLFYANGVMSSEGDFDRGNRVGEWTYYTNVGNINAVVNYDDGELNGPYKDYYSNGNINSEGTYENGRLEGSQTSYYRHGGIYKEGNYRNGKLDGLVKYYFRTGEVEYEIEYSEGNFDGKFKRYYSDGSLREEKTFDEGNLEGKRTVYYRNGQVLSTTEYKDGDRNGEYKAYFENGKLEEEGEYKDGYLIGESVAYYDNGNIMIKNVFDESGKRNGTSEEFDRSGAKTHEFEYRKGDLIGYKFYDLEGNVLKEGSKSGKYLEYEKIDPYGNKRAEGQFEKGNSVGEWKYFSSDGFNTDKYTYKDDELNGVQYEYFKDGTLSEKYDMIEGSATGNYTSYAYNKVKLIHGYRFEGDKQGEWVYRGANEKVQTKYYYRGGELDGWSEYYTTDGKHSHDMFYESNVMIKTVYFDTAGNANQWVKLDKGSGTYDYKFSNGKSCFVGHYVNGAAHGEFIWYYPDGSVATKGAYFNDERHGEWVWYHRNGKVDTRRYYKYGTRDSTHVSYDREGNMTYSAQYKDGELSGEVSYYYVGLGKKRYTSTYVDGSREGEMIYYNERGDVILKRFYVDGNYRKYAVRDKNGKMGDWQEIPTEGTTKIESYHPNGKLAISYSMKFGYFEGDYIVYFSTGKMYFKEHHENGVEKGTLELYRTNGKLFKQEEWEHGEKHGIAKQFNSSGKLIRSETYVMGDLEGEVVVYDKYGKKIGTAFYFNDEYYDGVTK